MELGSVDIEQRRAARVYSNFSVQVRPFRNGFNPHIYHALSQDVSETGIKLNSFDFFSINARLFMELLIAEHVVPVRSVGRVVWIERISYQDRYKLGVDFSELTSSDRHCLQHFILRGSL
ncbi:MAG: PilZ domain-containing protein [Candidatus Omnitrophica bacterium]|nr:PilZ domain-containing protein [Candidatus Omnitrophota bacterium]